MKKVIISGNGPSLKEIDYSRLPQMILMYLDAINFILKINTILVKNSKQYFTILVFFLNNTTL